MARLFFLHMAHAWYDSQVWLLTWRKVGLISAAGLTTTLSCAPLSDTNLAFTGDTGAAPTCLSASEMIKSELESQFHMYIRQVPIDFNAM